MRVIRFLVLLSLTYVCLDIANPLMPGAFQFAHGTIQAVEADRARTGGAVDGPVTLPPVRLAAAPVRRPSPLRRLRPARRTLRGRPPHPKRPMSRAACPPSAEDH